MLLTLEGVVGLGLLGLGDGLPGLHILSCCQVRLWRGGTSWPGHGLRHSLCLHALSRRRGGGFANWHRGRATGPPQRRWDRFSSAARLRRKARSGVAIAPFSGGGGTEEERHYSILGALGWLCRAPQLGLCSALSASSG